jgi:hypothetical protein
MIDKNRIYRTRDGREVRIYATDGDGSGSAIHGAIKNFYGWVATVWNPDGKCHWGAGCYGDPTPANDLIEVRPRHKRTVWLTVWSFNYIQVMSTPEWQISKSGRSGEIPYACIKVELDFEEGEGL